MCKGDWCGHQAPKWEMTRSISSHEFSCSISHPLAPNSRALVLKQLVVVRCATKMMEVLDAVTLQKVVLGFGSCVSDSMGKRGEEQ